jgi:tetratricopeptide (TPR) repeat protein
MSSYTQHAISEKQKRYLLVLAYIYLKNNQMEKAIIIYKALWYLYPENEGIAFCLSYLFLSTGQYDTALTYAESYIGNKNNGMGFLLKGLSLHRLGRRYEAQQAIKQYLNPFGA